ncbi:CASP-like protein 4A3 [Musa acuminata AAA Group]|uniref:CASP-like protein 4A3 n=1 Tax=Musa acuminata AAA Group TaxID=214697 RepID=UPI0031D5189F
MSSPERSPPPPPHNTPERPESPEPAVTALAVAGRLSLDELAVMVSVVDGGEGGGRVSRKAENGLGAVMRAALGLRVSAALLCLVSFSVMVADNTEGWAGDSFGRYSEYRYLVSVTAIAFGYSAFHIYAKVHHVILKKYIIRSPINYYFDLTMDQILAYLLIAASSVAASRNDLWMSRFGSDEFMDMANVSIAISFLAFVALALSALISAHNFFRRSSGVTSQMEHL